MPLNGFLNYRDSVFQASLAGDGLYPCGDRPRMLLRCG